MMQARNEVKRETHQQGILHARIIKLQKEEQKANKRINEAQRKTRFIAEMHQIKAQKMKMKEDFRAELQAKEDANRFNIRRHRTQISANISSNKLSVLEQNKYIR